MKQPTVDTFQALSDPNRRFMLRLLSKESLTINSLADNFDITRPAVSKHIKILHMAGFITIQDLGRERHCMLSQQGFHDLQEWISYFDQFWHTKLKKLEELLNKKSKK
jgi:DNA-binding transcriptional ArsR family regulator